MRREDTLKQNTADRSANLQNGGSPKVSRAEAAKLLNVSERLVNEAAKVMADSPELMPAIEAGEMTVHAATKQAKANTTATAAPARKVTPGHH